MVERKRTETVLGALDSYLRCSETSSHYIAPPSSRGARVARAMTMAVRKPTNKVNNKKLRRRREGLSTKCYEYGELDGVELALFVRYPKGGDFYSYMSRRELPWLRDVAKMVCCVPHVAICPAKCEQMTHPKARTEFPEDLRGRVEDTRRKTRKTKDAGVLVEADVNGQSGRDGSSTPAPVLSVADFPDFVCNLTLLRNRFKEH